MRILEFDQFEFPNDLTEEHLRLFIERREHIPDPDEFLQHCLSGDERSRLMTGHAGAPYEASLWRGEIHELLSRFTSDLVPELAGSHVTPLLLEPDDITLLIVTPYRFILYEWGSAA